MKEKQRKPEPKSPLQGGLPNPDKSAFEELEAGIFRVRDLGAELEGTIGGYLQWMRHKLFGLPIATAQAGEERLSKLKALAVMSSDNMSSSAYATEEIMRVLVLAGAGALLIATQISLVIAAVLAIVVVSYLQVIRAYPRGGGSYIVARKNLGTLPGLTAAASLLIDYVLTVSVSVAAGIAALTSTAPGLYDFRVPLGVGLIAILVIGNLRGIRESGTIFSFPTYVYIFGLLSVLAYGIFRLAAGTFPTYTPPTDWVPQAAAPLTIYLLLRAFTSGAVALTGIEAISNGVMVFKRPRARNASATLLWMGVIFGTIFLGITVLSAHMGLVPDPSEKETLVSLLVRQLAGNGVFHYFIQISTALILVLAANTAFVGFPQLSAVLAEDEFMPNQFSRRGERLALSTGIIALGILAALLLFAFQGSVAKLIPLYTIGVFVAFTLSQVGMVVHWRRVRKKGWRLGSVLNGTGAVVTCVVAIEAVIAKFTSGAYIVLIMMPLLVLMMRGIRRHYQGLEQELHLEPSHPLPQAIGQAQTVIVPIAKLNKTVIPALNYARRLSQNIMAVHITDDLSAAEELRKTWEEWVQDVPLIIIESPFRNWTGPLLKYIDSLSEQHPETPLTIVLPEFIPRRWWQHLLHSQSAMRLKLALLSRENVVVVDIPYHLAG